VVLWKELHFMLGGWLILYMLHPSPLHLTHVIYYSDLVMVSVIA